MKILKTIEELKRDKDRLHKHVEKLKEEYRVLSVNTQHAKSRLNEAYEQYFLIKRMIQVREQYGEGNKPTKSSQ